MTIIKKADNGGTTVVMNKEYDKKKIKEMISDKTYL